MNINRSNLSNFEKNIYKNNKKVVSSSANPATSIPLSFTGKVTPFPTKKPLLIVPKLMSMSEPSFKRKIYERLTAIADYNGLKRHVAPSESINMVKEAESTIAHKLGVKVNYADNIHISKLANSALEDVANNGYKLPKEIHVIDFDKLSSSTEAISSGNPITDTGVMIPFTQSIFLNSSIKWGQLQPELTSLKQQKVISTDNPKHFIWGLVCENLIENKDHELFKKLYTKSPHVTDAAFLKENVSDLASESCLLAVKEMFAKMMDGKQLSEKELRLYRKYQGPNPQQYKNSFNVLI